MRHALTALCFTVILAGACSKPTPEAAPVPSSPASPPTAPDPATTPSTPANPAPSTRATTTAPASSAPTPLTEKAKIEKLLEILAASPDTFNRNGSDYTGKQAADHLRSKWSAAGSRVKTARDFIDGLASKSSMSGKPYTVKRANGETVNAADWFNPQLKLIEDAAASPPAQAAPPAAAPTPKAQDKVVPKHVGAKQTAKPSPEEVLEVIANATEKFVIGYEYVSGTEMARRLTYQYDQTKKFKLPVEDFIAEFCTHRRGDVNDFYLVTNGNEDDTRPMANWLRDKFKTAK